MAQTQKKNAESADWSTLKGKYFHAFDSDGYVRQQGVIIDLLNESTAIIQYFEWISGSPWEIKAVWVSKIVDDGWALYESSQTMREAYGYGLVKIKPIEDS